MVSVISSEIPDSWSCLLTIDMPPVGISSELDVSLLLGAPGCVCPLGGGQGNLLKVLLVWGPTLAISTTVQ